MARKDYDIVDRLFAAYAVAKDKHPDFADGCEQGLNVILEEVKEFTNAVNNEMRYRQEEEAFDIIICCLRYILREYDREEKIHIEHWEPEDDDPVIEYYEQRILKK